MIPQKKSTIQNSLFFSLACGYLFVFIFKRWKNSYL